MVQHPIAAAKPEITIGVLGQDGHGKTSLTTALMQSLSRQNGRIVEGGEIDMRSLWNRPEDMNDPSEYETATRRYRHIDCRRHIDVMMNLILQWMPLHGAILVVSSLEGVTAQTKAQLSLARRVGTTAVVIFITKCDLIEDSELLEVVELEVRELLANQGYAADTPIIRGNAIAARPNMDLCNSSIQELLEALDTAIPTPPDLQEMPFLMSIEDVFTITGRGIVVTGRVERGRLKISEAVEIVGLGPTRTTIATELEQFHKPCDLVFGGDNAGVLLRNVNRTEIERGQMLAAPGTIQAYSQFHAELYLLGRDEQGSDYPALSDTPYGFFLRTTDISGTLKWDESAGPIRGGDTIHVTVALESVVALEPGLRFALRKNGRTLGWGVITELLGGH